MGVQNLKGEVWREEEGRSTALLRPGYSLLLTEQSACSTLHSLQSTCSVQPKGGLKSGHEEGLPFFYTQCQQ
jgi:hypothetical protein